MKKALLIALATAIVSLPAHAQFNEAPPPEPARDLAAELGYEIIRINSHFGSPERDQVDKQFMSKIAEAAAPGQIYGFSFEWFDLTGDGADDLILVPKIPSMYPPEGFDNVGATIFVYVKDAEGVWRLELEGGQILVGIRPNSRLAGGYDIGLVQQDRVVEFSWDGNDFIDVSKVPQS